MDKIPRAFIIGLPVEHSRSPILHNHWIEVYGLSGIYEKHAVQVEEFSQWMGKLEQEGFVGGSITLPHKEAAYELVQHLEPAAKRIGAVNTIWLKDGILCGDNTDGYGFLGNLDDRAPDWDANAAEKKAVVLGAGGASRAIIDSLVQRGFGKVLITNRTFQKAEKLANHFGATCEPIPLDEINGYLDACDLVVNTTSVGMNDDSSPLIDLKLLPKTALVTDVVYTPLMTPLLKEAQSQGLKIVDGAGMLLHQGVPGFERWFGVRPQVTAQVRQLVLQDLGIAPPQKETLFLGLTGSIGMGKSTTAQMFRDAEIPVFDSDATVHELYEGPAVALVEAAFPGTTSDGKVDRTALGKIVIGNETEIKRLEALIHPLVRDAEIAFRKRMKDEKHPIAVMDAPLLFERGNAESVDKILVVTAPAELQKQRVLERPGMDEDKFNAILARQVPDAEKRAKADYVIDTSLGLEAAQAKVTKIIETVKAAD